VSYNLPYETPFTYTISVVLIKQKESEMKNNKKEDSVSEGELGIAKIFAIFSVLLIVYVYLTRDYWVERFLNNSFIRQTMGW
jgi:cytochrome c biogenesis factor